MAKEKQETRFSAELLDELLEGQDPATVLRSVGLVGDLKKALAERMLNAEMDMHLGGKSIDTPGPVGDLRVAACRCMRPCPSL